MSKIYGFLIKIMVWLSSKDIVLNIPFEYASTEKFELQVTFRASRLKLILSCVTEAIKACYGIALRGVFSAFDLRGLELSRQDICKELTSTSQNIAAGYKVEIIRVDIKHIVPRLI